jgi:hypothetical protein
VGLPRPVLRFPFAVEKRTHHLKGIKNFHLFVSLFYVLRLLNDAFAQAAVFNGWRALPMGLARHSQHS